MSKLSDADLSWEKLDKGKFLSFSAGMLFGVRVLIYPSNLVKTRLQAQCTINAFKVINQQEGLRGFYKGFLTTAFGILPAQLLYISSYEAIRHKLQDQSEFWRSFVSGALASVVSSAFAVPLEVVAQRLMVQDGINNPVVYRGGIHAFQTILASEGVRGLYRGYWVQMLTLAPSSGIWWATYRLSRGAFLPPDVPHEHSLSEILIEVLPSNAQTGCAVAAGVTSAILVNPLDVVKTRIQVLNREGNLQSGGGILGTFRRLIAVEGVRSLGRGVGARIMAAIPSSVLMLTVYEQSRRLAATK